MGEQLEFPFIESTKRRDQLLTEVDLSQFRNRLLMASLLGEINRFKPGECYPGQTTLARRFKQSERSIQRAFDSLKELDLVVVQKRNRRFADGTTKSVNHYWINWTELERLVESQRSRSIRKLDVALAVQSVTTLSPDHCDSLGQPLRQFDPSVMTPSCHAIGVRESNSTTTEPVVVADVGLTEANLPGCSVATPTIVEPSKAPNQFEPIRDLLMHYKPFPVAKHAECVEAAIKRGWTIDFCNHLIEYASKCQIPAGHLCRWFLHGSPPEEFAKLEARRLNPIPVSPKLDFRKLRQERMRNQEQFASQPSTMDLFRLEKQRQLETNA